MRFIGAWCPLLFITIAAIQSQKRADSGEGFVNYLDILAVVGALCAIIQTIYIIVSYHYPKKPPAAGQTASTVAGPKLWVEILLTLICLMSVSFDYYERDFQPANWTGIPNIMTAWGYQPPNEDYITFDGDKLLSLQNDYKIVGVALHYDGKEDILDENNLLASSEYSIMPFLVTMVIPWSPQYTSEVEAGEKKYNLLFTCVAKRCDDWAVLDTEAS